ncbi:hypothetical protein [uncultured Clostridium sp.]|uniref:hypothetical protein n=1 Tax=uncultured Clostridium sp. TaxID=59620 RepID=UPI0025E52ED2|nr:hypothetical protein [uncultured Clostridium sp.]
MKEYEYKVEQIEIELKSIFKFSKDESNKELVKKLNVFGKEGWQLCGVDGTWFYFKREVI